MTSRETDHVARVTDASPANPDASPPSLSRSSLVTLGIPVPIAIALADMYALRFFQASTEDWRAYLAYALFVSQSMLLGALVGSQVKRQPLWWGILLWGVVLIDLQVFAVAVNDTWSPANTVGIAFASAQIGALICFGVLGTLAARIRIPTVAIGLAFTFTFAVALSARDVWYSVLFLQALATAVVCLVFRWLRFRIERVADSSRERDISSRMQFSIRHLFYWMTGVAIIVGFGRLIGWQNLMSMGNPGARRLLDLIVFAPLLTLVSILAMWGALGRERWIARLVVLLMMLPGIGALLGVFVAWSANLGTGVWIWVRLFPVRLMHEAIEVGTIWSVLAGTLLMGLLLVFRTSGNRLQRNGRLRVLNVGGF